MGIMTRMLRLWKADLHGVMDQIEDKELLLNQYLREMESSLKDKEAHRGHLEQTGRRIEHDMLLCRDEIDRLGRDIDSAVAKEKDDIARLLIRKRRSLEASCHQLQSRLRELGEERKALHEVLETQRLQYDQLKIRAAAFRTRSQSQRWTGVASDMDDTRSFGTVSEEEIELELLQRKESRSKEVTHV
jgi:phage shock protein A